MALHDILIGGVIVLILFVQFGVFATAITKINLYKNIIPNSENFQMVKIYIPESKIKTLSVDEILKNEHLYSSKENHILDLIFENEEDIMIPYLETNNEFDVENHIAEVSSEDSDFDDDVWITRENEDKKIPFRYLKEYELLGWKRI
jgi:hypothetical protein